MARHQRAPSYKFTYVKKVSVPGRLPFVPPGSELIFPRVPEKKPSELLHVVALEQQRRLAGPVKVRKARLGGIDQVQGLP